MDYAVDLNCAVIAAEAHGPMTLEEVAKRLDISLVRVMQIENAALVKMKKRMPELRNE
jgi:DNA-directed RNA polymerase sigma subunit (sigma70/sigma32)